MHLKQNSILKTGLVTIIDILSGEAVQPFHLFSSFNCGEGRGISLLLRPRTDYFS